ncbi:DnaJ domain-containing protein [Aliarcobacter faecis]|uniref:J domain-containing protein n=1 Tax=Aliarcobacter faecis TaxID=1564138 RepID=UPI00047AAE39|nr:DnaJ domain-containing protein [Aliarcobacter faecis]QKF73542.1 DnaJ domain-containing protein [Aliarcobacter faecis]
MGQIINLAITILILYLIFTNFGTFLMIIGGIILFFAILTYFIRKSFLKNASRFQYKYQSFDFNNFNQNFNNSDFKGNFYNQTSKLEEAKEFFGFSFTPSKDDIKKRYKELARVYHPDLNGGDEEKMKKLNEYRDILMQAYAQ